jgi:chromosomal replication initiation ATPase DnaA
MNATTAQEQFISDFLMVAENDQEIYNNYRNIVEDLGVISGAQKIQEEFEDWISDLAEQEKERGNEVGQLLLGQLLIGWGSDCFYHIAKRFYKINEESN